MKRLKNSKWGFPFLRKCKQQQTFQPSFVSGGTSRFNEGIRSKQMTFQQSDFQSAETKPQPLIKKVTDQYFKGARPTFNKDGNTCHTHGKQYQYACTTVGCQQGLMCEDCQQECPNMTNKQEFFDKLNQSIGLTNLDNLNKALDAIQNEVQLLFGNLRSQIEREIKQFEELFLQKLIIETSKTIYLPQELIYDIFSNQISKEQQVNQTNKMIYNGVIKIPELYNTLVDEKVRLDKKYKKLKGECETVVINFIRSFSKHLRGECEDFSENQPQLLLRKKSNYHTNKNSCSLIEKLKSTQTLKSHLGKSIVDLCLISNNLLASASNNGEIIIWKIPYYYELFRFQHGIECYSIAACQDELESRFLVSAGKDDNEYQIYLWNIDLRCKAGDVTGHTRQLRKIVSLTKQRIVWCQEDSNIIIWSLNQKTQLHEINVHSAWINDICKISKNSIASCSRDFTVAVIDFDTAQIKYVIKDVTYVNSVLSISPDTFAYSNYNGFIKIYSTDAPLLIHQIQVFNNWLDSNCIWYMARITNQIIAASNANGEISFIKIDSKDQALKTLKMNVERISETVLYIPAYKQFVTTSSNEIKILS
ncbi:hypothetical protein pb186bvf_014962 [Paramecium bursaria]